MRFPPTDRCIGELDDLRHCAGLVMSPTRFGNMAAPLKYFLDQSSLWLSGALIDKPAGVIHLHLQPARWRGNDPVEHAVAAVAPRHVGGRPAYSEAGLLSTTSGGTPYGASHWGAQTTVGLDDTEAALCRPWGAHCGSPLAARSEAGRARRRALRPGWVLPGGTGQQLADAWLQQPPWIIWLGKLLPLVIFLPGMLRDRLRSYIWLCFVCLLYFVALVERMFALPGNLLAIAVGTGAVVTLFIAAMMCAGARGNCAPPMRPTVSGD